MACQKQFLDKTDLSGIDERIWSNEASATLYLNNLYSLVMPGFPTSLASTSDESNTGNSALLGGTLSEQNVTEFSATTYQNIRKINILLKQLPTGSLPKDVQTKIMAQAYFLRSFKYFELVKLYGGVPYVTFPQDWLTDSLYVPRNKTSECIELLVKDLDSAALAPSELIATQPNRGRITRYAALGLKGRVLLYWASPQFVGPNTPSSAVTIRWQKAFEANKQAYDEMIAGGHALYSNFSNILLDETAANKELIMIRSYGITENYNAFETASRPSSMGTGGNYQPTLNLVNAFPMADGTSITESADYDPALYFKNRDPRFYATIAYNGSVWPLGGQSNAKIWTFQNTSSETTTSSTGFYNKKGVNLSPTRDRAANGTTDWVEMRLAEVMLNLAECAAHTNNLNLAYEMLTAIRSRAGIINTNGFYGLKPGMNAEEMVTAILLERQVELAFEGKRYQDLRRTRLFTAMKDSIRQTLVITAKSLWLSNRTINTSNNHINLNGTAAILPALVIRDEIDINTKSATATAVLTSGSITEVVPGLGVNAGSGYTNAPRVTVGNAWLPSTNYSLNQQVFYQDNLYTVTKAGRTALIPPTHISGIIAGGTADFIYAGKVAKLKAIVAADGSISAYDVVNAGSGYTNVPAIIAEGYNTYLNTAKGVLNPRFNFLDKYYFYDIPRDDINRNPKLLQNPGWGGNDTFDPYQ